MDERPKPGKQSITKPLDCSKAIYDQIESLRKNVGAKCAFMVDASGQLIIECGAAGPYDLNILSVLIACGMATGMELANVLQEEHISTLHFYEGEKTAVYGAVVNEKALIYLIIEGESGSPRMGMVWLYLKRTIEELQKLIINTVLDHEFSAASISMDIQNALEDAWQEKPTAVELGTDPSNKESIREIEVSKDEDKHELLGYEQAMELGLVRDVPKE